MNGIMFIFSDLLQLTGCDPWQAQCIETLTLLFVFAPIVAGPASGTGGVGPVQTGRQRPDPRCKSAGGWKGRHTDEHTRKRTSLRPLRLGQRGSGPQILPGMSERRAQDTRPRSTTRSSRLSMRKRKSRPCRKAIASTMSVPEQMLQDAATASR